MAADTMISANKTRVGDRFKINGYDIVARAAVFEGGGMIDEFLVLNNNCTHYLVASYGGSTHATLAMSYWYGYSDWDEARSIAYKHAIEKMAELAMEN